MSSHYLFELFAHALRYAQVAYGLGACTDDWKLTKARVQASPRRCAMLLVKHSA